MKKNEKSIYETIINILPGNIYWKDRDGRFLGCNINQALSDGFTSPSELLGKTVYETCKNLDLANKIDEIDERIMMNDVPHVIEEKGSDANGNIATYISHKIPLHDKKNRVTGLLGISIDITYKKESEALREKVNTMQMLGGTIAHEIRNPLLAINAAYGILTNCFPDLLNGYEQAVKSDLPIKLIRPAVLKTLPDTLQIIKNEIDAANMFIDTLLSKIKENVDTNDFEQCTISDCIEMALKRYSFGNQEKSEIIHWLQNDDFTFMGNKNMMVHVLFNLIKNALNSIGVAGKGGVTIWVEKKDRADYLHFKDTGTGISKDILPQLFSRFFSKTRYGTGLGLAFCKNVMESMGGDITCQSVEGEYAEFILSFPK